MSRRAVVRSVPPPASSGAVASDDEITIERRVRVPVVARQLSQPPPTRRMERIDPALLALARGDVPSQPPSARDSFADAFGGLIPVDDAGNELVPMEPEPFDLAGGDD